MKHLKQISLSLPNSRLLLFIFTFLFLNTVFPQVTIREKVVISPDGKQLQSSSRTLRASFSRPAGVLTTYPCDPGRRVYNVIELWNRQCSSYAYQSIDGGSGEVSISAVAGTYSIMPSYNTNTSGIAAIDVSLDNIFLFHREEYREAPIDPCQFAIGKSEYFVSLSSDYTFSSTYNVISHGGLNTFGLTATTTTCSPTVWNIEKDDITIRIVSGNEFGNLQLDGQKGPSFPVKSSDVGRVSFIADGKQPYGGAGFVQIDASISLADLLHSA